MASWDTSSAIYSNMIIFLRMFPTLLTRVGSRQDFRLTVRLIAVLSPSSDRAGPANKDSGASKNVKLTASYAPLEICLRDHRWSGLTRKQTKELNPAAVFSILGTFG